MTENVERIARPRSVRWAECAYLAAIALHLAASAMIWDQTTAVYGAGLAIADLAFTLGLLLLLVLMTTRRGSRGARGVLAVLTALTAAYRLWQVLATEDGGTAIWLLGAQGAIMAAGAVLLFRPDTLAWFAVPPEEDEMDDDDDRDMVA